jgi:hypothetical protein
VSAGAANRFSLRRRREVARRVKEFPEPVRPSKYPWGDWLDGQIWELKSGEDFDGKPTNFRSVALAQARNRGGRVSRMARHGCTCSSSATRPPRKPRALGG